MVHSSKEKRIFEWVANGTSTLEWQETIESRFCSTCWNFQSISLVVVHLVSRVERQKSFIFFEKKSEWDDEVRRRDVPEDVRLPVSLPLSLAGWWAVRSRYRGPRCTTVLLSPHSLGDSTRPKNTRGIWRLTFELGHLSFRERADVRSVVTRCLWCVNFDTRQVHFSLTPLPWLFISIQSNWPQFQSYSSNDSFEFYSGRLATKNDSQQQSNLKGNLEFVGIRNIVNLSIEWHVAIDRLTESIQLETVKTTDFDGGCWRKNTVETLIIGAIFYQWR